MSICVVGTSNAILRGGWYDGLASTYSSSVVRYALGGAPFIQLAQFLHKIREGKFKYVILDTTPNDDTYHSSVGHEWFFQKLYFEFVASIAQTSTLILLQLPTEKYLHTVTNIQKFQASVVNSLGGYFLNVGEMINEKSPFRPDIKSVHEDNYHIIKNLAYSIGQTLGLTIEKIEPSKSYDGEDYIKNFEIIYGTSSNNAIERVETSLVQCDFQKIKTYETILFDRERFCLGFLLNSGGCSSYIKLDGSQDTRYISMFYNPQKNRNIVRFQPICHGIWMKRLSAVKPGHIYDVSFQSDLIHLEPFHAEIGWFLTYNGDPKSITWQDTLINSSKSADLRNIFENVGADALRETMQSLAR
ncbi:MAG: hypothetical protein ACRC2R_21150 [Xenococcaceae cyanobacterium]